MTILLDTSVLIDLLRLRKGPHRLLTELFASGHTIVIATISSAARSGKTLHLSDMIGAASALEHGMAVATDNRKDFAVAGLELYPIE